PRMRSRAGALASPSIGRAIKNGKFVWQLAHSLSRSQVIAARSRYSAARSSESDFATGSSGRLAAGFGNSASSAHAVYGSTKRTTATDVRTDEVTGRMMLIATPRIRVRQTAKRLGNRSNLT